MAASFPARRSAPQRRRGQQGVERLGCWDWLASPGQLVEIVKAIQRQGQLQKRIQRDQSFALKSLQRTPGHARARRQFSLRQVHGKTPGLEPPCNSCLHLLNSPEIDSQDITSSIQLYNITDNILSIDVKNETIIDSPQPWREWCSPLFSNRQRQDSVECAGYAEAPFVDQTRCDGRVDPRNRGDSYP